MVRIRNWFIMAWRAITPPPDFTGSEESRQALLLHGVTRFMLVVGLLSLLVLTPLAPEPRLMLTGVLPVVGVGLVVLVLLRWGAHRAGAWALVLSIWLVLAFHALDGGGLYSPLIHAFLVPVLLAMLLLGVRVGVGLALLSLAYQVVLLTVTPPPDRAGPGDPVWILLMSGALLLLLGWIYAVAVSSIESALAASRANAAELTCRHAELEREMAERARLEEAYRAVVDHSLQGLLILNEHGLAFCNAAVTYITGYTEAELRAMDGFAHLIHADDRSWALARLAARLRGENPPNRYEYRIIHKDGAPRWIEIFAFAIEFQGQRAVQSAIIDITERKQAEAALRRSEERYRILAQNLPQSAVLLYDHDLRYELVDGPELAFMGYSKAEMEGRTIFEMLPPDFAREASSYMRAALDGEFVSAELPFEDQYYQLLYAPLRDPAGQVVNGMILARNITDAKLSEIRLIESERRFRTIFEQGPLGMLLVNLDDEIISANRSLAAMMGLAEIDLLRQHFLDLCHPEDRPRLRTALAEPGLPGSVRTVEHRCLRADGSVRWTATTTSLMLDELAQPLYRLLMMVDITDRKAAEQRALDLALAQEKIELMRTFIGNVSHDLKTPLSTIVTSLWLLERAPDAERRAEKIGHIREQTDILGRSIQNLLMISRLDYEPDLERAPVDLNRLIGQVVQQMRPAADGKGQTIITDLTCDRCAPAVDRDAFLRVLINLVENAINYTPDGRTITLRTRHDDGRVVIEVIDEGIGIPASDRDRIFERFWRSERARDTVGTGSGLGLAIVKKIVEMHDGAIDVDSTVDIGTTFRITLPLPQPVGNGSPA